MPACRLYARQAMAGNSPRRPMIFLSSLEFLMVHHFWPNLREPQSFSEKIWGRMLFDRNPHWILVSDKLRMRAYVAEKAGSEYLVPLLWSGDDPNMIPWEALPSKFVIKATHGCGYNLIVQDKARLESESVRQQLRKWLRSNYGETFGLGTEWCYRHILPSLVIEEFLEEDGRSAPDYKFWCFSGRAECLTVHCNRHEMHVTQTFDRSFKPYKFPFHLNDSSQVILAPPNFEAMLHVAETLAGGFDFIRIDMYNVRGRILLGEFAVYPGGGFLRFLPRELDFALGAKWRACCGEARG